MEEKIKQIYEHFGKENQIHKAIEELCELCDELEIAKSIIAHGGEAKDFTGSITQEIADVIIMLHQLQIALDISYEELNEQIEYKLNRTIERMGNGYYEQRRKN